MENKTRTMVNIAGKEYALAGFESEEYIHRVAIYVDRKMTELSSQYPGLSTNMLAVLASLNIADDYLKAHEQAAALAGELESAREELKKLKIECALVKEEKKTPVKRSQPAKKLFDSLK